MDCHNCLFLLCAVGIQNVIDKYQIVGIPGDDGVQGDRGPQGAQGVPGPKGQKGQRGQQGLNGLNGTQGPIGLAGSKGQKGEKEVNGLRGDAGTQGQKGERGCVGLTGPQGPKGEKGVSGTRGFSGSKGQKGERGVNGLRGPPGPTTGGVVYTRWGRTTCPSTSRTQLLYAGRAAGTRYNQRGGGANYLCLPEQAQYSTYTAGAQDGRAFLYGAEYQTTGSDNGPLRSFHYHNVPCAVCYTSTRETVVIIPA